MAKTGFWLRGAQGKLAGASIAKGADGSTVIREVVTPKNPQTTAQKIQRIIMATVVQAYSKMSAICDHSYEGLSTGAKCMNRFNQLNANMLRRWVSERIAAGDTAYDILDFCPSGEQRLADNPWIISSGSLPQVVTDVDQDAQFAAFALPVNTYQGVCDYYGLQRGDQLTLITVEEEAYPNISGSFHFARIILDPMDGQGNQLPMSTQFVGASGVVSPSLRNETDDLTISYVNSTVQFLHDTDFRNVLLGGVIVSRKENDKWRRSACTLSTGQSSSNGVSLGYCIDNFGATDVPTTNPNFLNNSGLNAPMAQGVPSTPSRFAYVNAEGVDITDPNAECARSTSPFAVVGKVVPGSDAPASLGDMAVCTTDLLDIAVGESVNDHIGDIINIGTQKTFSANVTLSVGDTRRLVFIDATNAKVLAIAGTLNYEDRP